MANVSSTLISNRAATPRVANDPWNNAVIKNTGVGVCAVTTSEDVGNVLSFTQIKANAVVRSVNLSCTAVAVGGAMDIGVYRTADDGGTVVDADLFASGFDLSTGPHSNTDITFESGEYTLAESMKPLWEVIGLNSDPNREYDLTAVVSTTFNGGPTSILISADVV